MVERTETARHTQQQDRSPRKRRLSAPTEVRELIVCPSFVPILLPRVCFVSLMCNAVPGNTAEDVGNGPCKNGPIQIYPCGGFQGAGLLSPTHDHL